MIEGIYKTGIVLVNNQRLALERIPGLWTHRLSTFTWGDQSGNRLALALLVRLTSRQFASGTFELFTTQIIGRIPPSDFTMQTVQVRTWARDNGWRGETDGRF